MEKNSKYSILLYYCYTTIDNPEEFREQHHKLCLCLDLRGRIIIAKEGLNGTVSGLEENCEKYMQSVKNDPRFKTIDFKIEKYHDHAFQKLNIRLKDEIVHSSLVNIDPNEETGKHLSPREFKEIKDQEDVVILDVRSNYEHGLGKFKNALTLDMDNFREFPEKVEELETIKDKKVVTYCTGGIKCEKASAYLLKKGFKDVYQLHGGIIKYGIEEGGEDFEGKCYVFDNRIAADINKVNPSIKSQCYVCGTESDHMVNCANSICNKHAPICEDCMIKMEGCCSEDCMNSPEKRPYNMDGYYPKKMNGYNPYKCSKRKKKEELTNR